MRLTDHAKFQEYKEAVITYMHLLEGPCTAEELMNRGNQFLRQHGNKNVAFEIVDSIQTMESLGIVQRHGEKISAVPMEDAIKILQKVYIDKAQNEATRDPLVII